MADQEFNIDINTRANLAGIEQTKVALTDLQRRAAATTPGQALAEQGAAATGAGAGLAGAVGIPTTAVGIGLALNAIIRSYGEYQLKIAEDLNQQLTTLTELSRKWSEIAENARTASDVEKLGAAGVGKIREAQAEFTKFQNQTQSWWKDMLDMITSGPGISELGGKGKKFFEEAANAQASRLAENVVRTNEQAAAAMRLGDEYNKQFEKWRSEPITQAVKEITGEIEKWEQREKAAITVIDSEEARRRIENYKKDLGDIIKLESVRVEAIKKQVGLGAADVLKTQEAFDKEQARRGDEQLAKAQVARAEAAVLRAGGGPRSAEERERLDELQREVSPATQAFELAQTRRRDIIRNLAGLGETEMAQFMKDYPQQAQLLRQREAPTPGGDVETHRILQKLLEAWS